MDTRKKTGLGQRELARLLLTEHQLEISESTISGWIHKHVVPFAQEKTQFKPKPIPPKKVLEKLYIHNQKSASTIAKKFHVSTIIVINWLKKYGVRVRSHTESMNTSIIQSVLRDQKVTRPTREYGKLSPEKAYILGVLCGDGYIDHKFMKLEIRRDLDFMNEFIRCVEEVYGLRYKHYYYKHRNSYIVNVNAQIICKDLLNHDTFRTRTWRVPKAISESKSKGVVSHFLRALFDSDGSSSGSTVNMTLANGSALREVSSLLTKLNISNRVKTRSPYSTLTISHKDNLRKFIEEIGFTIQRKNDRTKKYIQHGRRAVRSFAPHSQKVV